MIKVVVPKGEFYHVWLSCMVHWW